MNEECLICGAPLEYLQEEVRMECFFCHRKAPSLPPGQPPEERRGRELKGAFHADLCH